MPSEEQGLINTRQNIGNAENMMQSMTRNGFDKGYTYTNGHTAANNEQQVWHGKGDQLDIASASPAVTSKMSLVEQVTFVICCNASVICMMHFH